MTDFITTWSGKKFHFLTPKLEEINIYDIAHALALTCRFGGHIKDFYSVAQHSVLVARYSPRSCRLYGLLHDAHEAYLHDVPRPIKDYIPGYRELADRIQDVINKKYDVEPCECVTTFDKLILATEARDLMLNRDGWEKLPEPLDITILPWDWQTAYISFLEEFFKLTKL